MHIAEIVNEQHRLAIEIEAVRRLVQLRRTKPRLRAGDQRIAIAVIAAKHAKHRHRKIVERLQREWRAIVTGMHHQ